MNSNVVAVKINQKSQTVWNSSQRKTQLFLNTFYKKASKKQHILARVCIYMNLNKIRSKINAFIAGLLTVYVYIWAAIIAYFHSERMPLYKVIIYKV